MLAEFGAHRTGPVPKSLDALFLTMEFLGPPVALLSVIVFGIVLPLTE